MKARSPFQYPQEKLPSLRRAIWLEAATIPAMLSVIVVVGLTMGSSQAMRTAWIEDLLALVPPISFLVAAPIRRRKPNAMFPFGHYRAGQIAFLSASTALTMFGLLLLYEAIKTMIMREHPTIGTTVVLGRQVWSGWLMIAALAYSMVVPIILGRLKLPVARELHEKTIHTDAQMNKDDWLTAGAAIAGILGVGMGWWWADAAAGGFISMAVIKDGVQNLRNCVYDLMDAQPRTLEGKPETEMKERVLDAVRRLRWVADAGVRLREEGSLVTGELMVVPVDERDPVSRIREASQVAESTHWRCTDITTIMVDREHLRQP